MDLPRPSDWRSAVPILVAAAIALGSAIGFLELAGDIREGDTDAFDNAVLSWLAAHRRPLWTDFFRAVTALGSWPVLSLFTAGVCAGTWLAGQRGMAVTLALAMGGGAGLSSVFKAIYARGRPTVVPHLETVASASFPSGHTIASVVFFGTLVLLSLSYVRRGALRAFLVGYSLLLGSLVALSRLYLGVHYPSDVAGGALVAVSWVLLVILAHRAFAARMQRGPRRQLAASESRS